MGEYAAKGEIAVESDAGCTDEEMRKQAVLTSGDMAAKTGHRSGEGVEVTAMPVYTIVRGQTVMEQGRVTGKPGYGRMLKGKAASAASTTAPHTPLSGME